MAAAASSRPVRGQRQPIVADGCDAVAAAAAATWKNVPSSEASRPPTEPSPPWAAPHCLGRRRRRLGLRRRLHRSSRRGLRFLFWPSCARLLLRCCLGSDHGFSLGRVVRTVQLNGSLRRSDSVMSNAKGRSPSANSTTAAASSCCRPHQTTRLPPELSPPMRNLHR